jgi:hypothetical protein
MAFRSSPISPIWGEVGYFQSQKMRYPDWTLKKKGGPTGTSPLSLKSCNKGFLRPVPSIRPYGATRDKRITASPSRGRRPRIEGRLRIEGRNLTPAIRFICSMSPGREMPGERGCPGAWGSACRSRPGRWARSRSGAPASRASGESLRGPGRRRGGLR